MTRLVSSKTKTAPMIGAPLKTRQSTKRFVDTSLSDARLGRRIELYDKAGHVWRGRVVNFSADEITKRILDALGLLKSVKKAISGSQTLSVVVTTHTDADHFFPGETVSTATLQPTEPDGLDKAIERGRHSAVEILRRKGMLTAKQLAKRLDVSIPTIHARRKRGRLIALPHPRGSFRFPDWQLDENDQPYPAIKQLNEIFASDAGPAPWSVYRFLLQPHPALDGLTGIEALKRRRTREVLNLVTSIQHGDFT